MFQTLLFLLLVLCYINGINVKIIRKDNSDVNTFASERNSLNTLLHQKSLKRRRCSIHFYGYQ